MNNTNNNRTNNVHFLRTSRQFPEDLHQLSVEVSGSYLDTANAVNTRIIGIFTINKRTVTGESWFLTSSGRQQSFRQVYTFVAGTPSAIPHGIQTANIDRFTRCWGTYTDAAGNWYGIIFATSVAIAGQFTFWVDPTNINLVSGAGVPTMVSGTIVIEWLAFT